MRFDKRNNTKNLPLQGILNIVKGIIWIVAGIQLSQNDMLRIGDWITVPTTLADGIVIDVSLSAVKVRNWNNTIVTLPPYTLVCTSFQKLAWNERQRLPPDIAQLYF